MYDYFSDEVTLSTDLKNLDIDLGVESFNSLLYNFIKYNSINIDMFKSSNFWLLCIKIIGRYDLQEKVLKTSQANYYKINNWFQKHKDIKYTFISKNSIINKVFELHRIIVHEFYRVGEKGNEK